jgi:hypothetical protein
VGLNPRVFSQKLHSRRISQRVCECFGSDDSLSTAVIRLASVVTRVSATNPLNAAIKPVLEREKVGKKVTYCSSSKIRKSTF